jgi:uncharacterized oxidoreductase
VAPRISTNPIAVGVPTGNGPLVLDISTSAVANGKLRIARLEGTECPPGWIQDAEGNPATDPHVMLADPPGTLLPFGGDQSYKGFGLGLLFDILCGGLSGGFCPPAPVGTVEWNNVLMIVWNPESCAGHSHFLSEADKLIDAVRNTPRKAGVEQITLPGDRSKALRALRLAEGIPIGDENLSRLTELARELNVAMPDCVAKRSNNTGAAETRKP